MEKEIQLTKLAETYNLTEIDRCDRQSVFQLIRKILSFDEYMPKLDLDIIPKIDHYRLKWSGWICEIDDYKWYEVFLSPNRDEVCDIIQGTKNIPSPESGEGPVKIFLLDKSNVTDVSKTRKIRKNKKRRY